ncbi:MAG: hypothetical protein EBV03_02950 [Proteobacteria bacterium]|nr:hypothetical protein [Pseudomonadota bacterium]
MLGINDFDKTLAKSDVYDKRSEIEYQAARGGMRFVARRVTDGVASVFEGMAEMFASFMTNTVGGVLEAAVGAEMARDIAAFAGTFGSKLVGLLGMGLAAGVSAGFTEMDYVHQKRNILKFYSGELGARLSLAQGCTNPPPMSPCRTWKKWPRTCPCWIRNCAVPAASAISAFRWPWPPP